MRIALIGFRHLGFITAACAGNYHTITVWDPDPEVLLGLRRGQLPFSFQEVGFPGSFPERIAGNFATSLEAAIGGADVVWITYDTPVDENDVADYEYVSSLVSSTFPYLQTGQSLLISSQVPVGFTRKMWESYQRDYPGVNVVFAHSPENIRRGKGLETFCHQDRIVLGIVETDTAHPGNLHNLLSGFCSNLLSMSPESAEISKHALNMWLAMSIVFANEMSELCESAGASYADVERALKSEARIGERAYLRAGEPYVGGTLGRDVQHLVDMGPDAFLAPAVQNSNRAHLRRAGRSFGDLEKQSGAGSLSIQSIIFSRDRAMQLDALLTSMRKHAPALPPLATVVYYASGEEYLRAYDLLREEHPEVCCWLRRMRPEEFKFRLLQAILARLTTSHYPDNYNAVNIEPVVPLTMLFADDDVFYRDMNTPRVEQGTVYSTRLGRNVKYCYTLDKPQKMGELDFTYPCSIDGHVYWTADLLPLLRRLEYSNPNELEHELSLNAGFVRRFVHEDHSCLVGIPNNVVQHAYPNRCEGGSAAELNRMFLEGHRIDLDRLDFSDIRGVHQAIPYCFQKVSALVAAS